jgi:hypothetical protein
VKPLEILWAKLSVKLSVKLLEILWAKLSGFLWVKQSAKPLAMQ